MTSVVQIADLERVVLEAVSLVDAHLMRLLLGQYKAQQHLFALKRYLLLSQVSCMGTAPAEAVIAP